MKKQQIIENNKLFNEFMERKPEKIGDKFHWADTPWFSVWYEDEEKVVHAMAEYAKYHSSWDWLMPVISKTNSMVKDRISEPSFPIIGKQLQNAMLNNQINIAFELIAKVIKWYNENK